MPQPSIVARWLRSRRTNTRAAHHSHHRANQSTISGTAVALNGDLAQFRQDNGNTVTLNQSSLVAAGRGLQVGGHYELRGYWSDNMFVAQADGVPEADGNSAQGEGYMSEGYVHHGGSTSFHEGTSGYPTSANASVQGIITSIDGSRVTIMRGLFATITIDDQQALNHGAAQNLYVGRTITAYGFWSGKVFFATSIG